MRSVFVFFILSLSTAVLAQKTMIKGKIIHATTAEPIAYANIYNITTGRGTLSNLDGYFEIFIESVEDSVQISFVGFQRQFIDLQSNTVNYTIQLEEKAQLLGEVLVMPKDDVYLFDLIKECRKKSTRTKQSAKAYYYLKTYEDNQQIELVEGFYNLDFSGYDLQNLDLKAGRLALQPVNGQFFISLENSRAISMLKLWEKNDRFPNAPTNYSKRKGQKRFYLYLNKKYLDDNQDSIYVIDYEPREQTGMYFTGKIWINKSQWSILKINLQCDACQKHPFQPLFRSDKLRSVSFNITKSFETIGEATFFKHVDFNYAVDYQRRIGKNRKWIDTIKANAVLYAYDFQQEFDLPIFTESTYLNDYQKINAYPYNDFFWNKNDEYRLNDHKKSNERFFLDTNSITNITISDSIPHLKTSKADLLKEPYMEWAPNRVFLQEIDTLENTSTPQVVNEYKLSVKIFVDINEYQDSFNVLTATIFDPYESFYVSMDRKARCFVNMYFDICEIQRRRLEKEILRIGNNPEKLALLFKEYNVQFSEERIRFTNSVKRGTHRPAMEQWNQYIMDELKVDNLMIFKPFEEE